MTQITIHVNSKNAIPCTARECAIALAVREFFPFAIVGRSCIIPFYDDKSSPLRHKIFNFSNQISKYIHAFDNGNKIEPKSFELDIPDWVIDQIDISSLTKKQVICQTN